jgi:hypothetical protein
MTPVTSVLPGFNELCACGVSGACLIGAALNRGFPRSYEASSGFRDRDFPCGYPQPSNFRPQKHM